MLNVSVHAASTAVEHDRQVLGLAAGEHRVDGDLLDRALDEIGRHDRDDLVGRSVRAIEHAQHARFGRRHDRQAVAPTAIEHRLCLVFEVGELHTPRVQLRALEPDAQIVGNRGIDGQRAAPRSHVDQVGTEAVDAGQ